LGGSVLLAISKTTKEVHILGYFFSRKSCVLTLTKTGWVTFWAIFSPTHLGPVLLFFKYFRKKI
jgi:hypothetical protein